MSRDQKPAKMRVIAAAEPAAVPARRAEDRQAAAAAAAPAKGPRNGLIAILYLLCCALGGTGVALLMRTFAS